jgi:hypothetical protein
MTPRLRVIPLPTEGTYLLVMDRVTQSSGFFDDPTAGHIQAVGSYVKEQSGGACHGFLIVEGELEIE